MKVYLPGVDAEVDIKWFVIAVVIGFSLVFGGDFIRMILGRFI